MLEARGDDADLERLTPSHCPAFILAVVCDGSWGIGLMWCGCCLIVACAMTRLDCLRNVSSGMGFAGFGSESQGPRQAKVGGGGGYRASGEGPGLAWKTGAATMGTRA